MNIFRSSHSSLSVFRHIFLCMYLLSLSFSLLYVVLHILSVVCVLLSLSSLPLFPFLLHYDVITFPYFPLIAINQNYVLLVVSVVDCFFFNSVSEYRISFSSIYFISLILLLLLLSLLLFSSIFLRGAINCSESYNRKTYYLYSTIIN